MPTVRESDSNVVIAEKRMQRHDPGRSKPQDKNVGILQKMKTMATLHLGVLERVHHQFVGFGVPIEGMTEFLDMRETSLYFNIKDAETSPCLWSVCNLAREVVIETFTYQEGFNTMSSDLLKMLLIDGYCRENVTD